MSLQQLNAMSCAETTALYRHHIHSYPCNVSAVIHNKKKKEKKETMAWCFVVGASACHTHPLVIRLPYTCVLTLLLWLLLLLHPHAQIMHLVLTCCCCCCCCCCTRSAGCAKGLKALGESCIVGGVYTPSICCSGVCDTVGAADVCVPL